jgi:hypothetical protein
MTDSVTLDRGQENDTNELNRFLAQVWVATHHEPPRNNVQPLSGVQSQQTQFHLVQ